MKKSTYTEFKDALRDGDIYFVNSFEEAAIWAKHTPDGIEYHVKFKGGSAFLAEKGSNVVAEAWREHILLTKDEYDNY